MYIYVYICIYTLPHTYPTSCYGNVSLVNQPLHWPVRRGGGAGGAAAPLHKFENLKGPHFCYAKKSRMTI